MKVQNNSLRILPAVLKKVPSFLPVVILFLTASCGDLVGDPVLSDAMFSRTFRYYYVQECSFDAIGLYDCSLVETVSPAYVVRIRIDGNGEATLNLDGDLYYYGAGEYSEDYDDYGSFYSFYESNSEATLYKDGSEIILWDFLDNTAWIYSYEF